MNGVLHFLLVKYKIRARFGGSAGLEESLENDHFVCVFPFLVGEFLLTQRCMFTMV